MQILEINDFSPPGGGAERHFGSLCRLLERNGHGIETFFPMESYRQGGRKEVREGLEAILSRHFDCAHIHTLDHKLTFLADMIKNSSIPVVQTLHDHRSICLNGVMFRHNSICELCRGDRHYMAGLKGCVNLPFAFSSYLRRGILKQNIYASVDRFIAPSTFLMNKFREWGFSGDMIHLGHFLELDEYRPLQDNSSDYCIYFGRLSSVKGLSTLLSAAEGLPMELRIVGSGEMKDELQSRLQAKNPGNVALKGRLEGEELRREVAGAIFAVAPSECYENAPYSIMEAFASGVPVVGSRCGGITEMIGHDERGLLFRPGDVKELRDAMKRLCEDRRLAGELGIAARAYAESHFNPDEYYRKLIEIMRFS